MDQVLIKDGSPSTSPVSENKTLNRMEHQSGQSSPQMPSSPVLGETKFLGSMEGGKTDGTLEMRCLIENGQTGAIIGQRGAHVAAIREKSGAFVSILKTEYHAEERILLLRGTPQQVARATFEVVQLLCAATMLHERKAFDRGVADRSQAAGHGGPMPEDSKEAATETVCTFRYLVHRSAVGAVIGKGGALIQSTQAKTGARIQISNDPLPHSSEKTVSMTGTAVQIYHAAETICQQLTENPVRPGSKVYLYQPGAPLFAPPFVPMPLSVHQQNQPLSATLAQQAASYAPLPAIYAPLMQQQIVTLTQKVAIPTVCAGCIIGKGGCTIRDLRLQSGCHISLADPEQATPHERIITITGAQEGIQAAVFMIRQLIAAWSQLAMQAQHQHQHVYQQQQQQQTVQQVQYQHQQQEQQSMPLPTSTLE